MPAQGEIVATVTYTLTGNCQQTARLYLDGIFNKPRVKVTIIGNGYTIGLASSYNAAATNNNDLIEADGNNGGTHVELRNVTLDLEYKGAGKFHSALHLKDQFTLTNVTIRNVYGTQAARVGSGALSNVLFENNYNAGFYTSAHAALEVFGNTTVNNAVFRGNVRGSSAIRTFSSGTITFTGCLTFSGNAPYNHYGTGITDNSTGECTGTIGNNDSLLAAPSVLDCGLPAPGNLDVSAIYTMKSDCDFSSYTAFGGLDKALWRIGDNSTSPVKIKINGNNYTIKGGSAHANRIWVAGSASLTIDNAITDSVAFYSFGTLNVTFTELKNSSSHSYLMGASTFSNVHFNGNRKIVAIAYGYYGKGSVTISDAKFTDTWTPDASSPNDPTKAKFRPAYLWTGTLTLSGCIVKDANSDPIYADSQKSSVTDNADYTCNSPQFGPLPVPEINVGPPLGDAPRPPSFPAPEICNPHCDGVEIDRENMGDCFQALGNIGLICRPWVEPPVPYFTIWRIDRESRGHFALGVTQPQVEARQWPGLIATSEDARVGVYLVDGRCFTREAHRKNPRMTKEDPLGCIGNQLTQLRHEALMGGTGAPLGWERFIVVAKGPNPVEDKVHTAILDNAVSGHVISTVDLFIGPPGVSLNQPPTPTFYTAPKPVVVTVPFVTPQAAQEDGSLVHVVRAGDTLHAIAVAYEISPWTIAKLNELEDEGRWLDIGQELLIREAGEAEAEDPRRVHVVKRGDTLNVIAVRYRVRPGEIVELNGLVNGGRAIYPGQELIIPFAG